MKVKTNELNSILASLIPGVSFRGIEEQLSHFMFTGNNIVAYNDWFCIKYPFVTDFSCSVKADKFQKVISGITEDELDLSLEKNRIKISSKSIKAKLSVLVEGSIMDFIEKITPGDLWENLPEGFLEGIQLCLFSASRDMTKKELCAIHVDGSRIYSTDNYRLSLYKMEDVISEVLLIHAMSAVELVKFPVVDFNTTGSWIHFRTKDGIVFSMKKMMGSGISNIENVFQVKGMGAAIPAQFKDALDTVISVFSEGASYLDRKVAIEIKEGILRCRNQGQEGWVESNIEIETDREVSFLINPVFLSQVLERTTRMKISKDKALFVRRNFKHVMVLPRKSS